MPRLPRVYIERTLYYVTCRGIPNQNIFKDKEDYEMYFGLLKKYKEQYGAKLYAYSLMPNHVHLLLEMDEKTTISTIMHDLNSNYTKYFNGRYMRKGHLFRERFKTALVEKEPKNLQNLTAYMHLNPKKLSLVLQAQTYPYSSYSLFLDYTQQADHALNIKNEIKEILNGLIGKDYIDFVAKMEHSDEFKKLHKKLQRRKMLGSDEFIKKVQEQIQNHQLETEEQEPDEKPQDNKIAIKTGTLLLVLALTASGVYVYLNLTKTPEKQIEKQSPVIATQKLDLNMTEWQIQLFLPDGQVADSDVISFNAGKFNSSHLSRLNYSNTNYTRIIEGDKIIWETMQTSSKGTASWRGEVKDGKMRGVLSLRPKEAPGGAEGRQKGEKSQDLSFKSTKYKRR